MTKDEKLAHVERELNPRKTGIFDQARDHAIKLDEILKRLQAFHDRLKGNSHHSDFANIQKIHEPNGLSSLLDECNRKAAEIDKAIQEIEDLF